MASDAVNNPKICAERGGWPTSPVSSCSDQSSSVSESGMQPFTVAPRIVKPHDRQTALDQAVYRHNDQLLHLKIRAEESDCRIEYATRNRLTNVTINELRAFIMKDGSPRAKMRPISRFCKRNPLIFIRTFCFLPAARQMPKSWTANSLQQ